jgi:hypothetical protein
VQRGPGGADRVQIIILAFAAVMTLI